MNRIDLVENNTLSAQETKGKSQKVYKTSFAPVIETR